MKNEFGYIFTTISTKTSCSIFSFSFNNITLVFIFFLTITSMGDKHLRVFQYSKLKILEKKKRESNPFFLFRNDMKRRAPKNIKMTELSKIASESWKKLSEQEKTEWKDSMK